MIKSFKQFVLETLSNDEESRLRELGMPTIDLEQLAERFNGTVDGNVLKLVSEWDMNLEDYGIDSEEYQEVTRKFWNTITISIDFYNSTVKSEGFISQENIDLSETFELDDLDWDWFFQNGEPSSMETEEIAEEIDLAMDAIIGYEDTAGYFDKVRQIIGNKLAEKYGSWEEEDDVSEKKKLKFHHSDAPDAKGRFKELGVQKLADWLIRTRGGNMQKITGSLNQQINFNKKKNPSYAKKMESTREAVKRKLAKRNK